MLLIDGHNLIGQMPNISLSDPDDEAKLLGVLANYHAPHPHEPITVIFDPGRDGGFGGARGEHGITVRYAPRGSTADAVIARIVRQASSARNITVVTSDNAVRKIVREHGAKLLSSEAFVAKLREHANPRKRKAAAPADEASEKPRDAEVEYWSTIFKEPKRKPSAAKPAPSAPSTAKPKQAPHGTADDVEYWLKIFGEPQESSSATESKPVRKKRDKSVDSDVEYWLNEFKRKRP